MRNLDQETADVVAFAVRTNHSIAETDPAEFVKRVGKDIVDGQVRRLSEAAGPAADVGNALRDVAMRCDADTVNTLVALLHDLNDRPRRISTRPVVGWMQTSVFDGQPVGVAMTSDDGKEFHVHNKVTRTAEGRWHSSGQGYYDLGWERAWSYFRDLVGEG